MRYPKHIILDLQRGAQPAKLNIWTDAYLQLPPVTLNTSTDLPLLDLKTRFSNHDTSLRASHLGSFRSSLTQSLFDIHFLRKEKLYTKLKYSRCPQYDIVSGGFAAIFAGFIGFLISEKFGIELVDSGDFYNAFMYGVFGVFALRPFLRIYSADNTLYHPLSPKYLLLFVRDLSVLSLRSFFSAMRFLFNRS